MKPRQHRRETQAVRGGTELKKKNAPLGTPIYQTSTFEVADAAEQARVTKTDMYYTRYGNPTWTAAETAIAELEATEGALLFASGMGAITTSLLSLLKRGDHVVAQRDIYGGSAKVMGQWLPRYGIETTFVDTVDYAQHAAAIRPNTKLLYLESPTNPTLRVVDLRKISALARQRGLLTLIDATLATPINQRPAEFGIDLVLHSGTKYFSGHSDLICGVAAGRRDLLQKIQDTRTTLGVTIDPHAAWLLLRGIKTLALRVQRHNENALRAAEFLSQHPKVRRVYYPFLEGNPQRALAMELMSGGGGLLSFEVEGTGEDASRVAEALKLFAFAPSLGGVGSLVTIPVLTSHVMISPAERLKMGVTEQMLRLSVGIENVDDLIADLDQALAAVGVTRQTAEVS